MAIHLFSRLVREGKAIPRFGTGESLRDYTFVSDVVDGLVRALERPNGFQVYNLGNDSPISLNGLIQKLSIALGCAIEQDILGDQPGDVPRTWASIERAQRDLGYLPRVGLDDGLAAFVRWLDGQLA